MTRQRRDPAEKAQEALDIARRKVNALDVKATNLRIELGEVTAELERAQAVADYLAQHPLLAQETE